MRETIYTIRGCPFRIALLSDLHDRPFGEAAASLERRRPDIICVTGDFVNAKRRPPAHVAAESENILPFFRMCAAAAPTFVSLGNHEWMLTDEDFALIRATGALVLDNRFVVFENTVIGGLTASLVTQYRRRVLEQGLQERYPYPRAADVTAKLEPDLDWLESFCACLRAANLLNSRQMEEENEKMKDL